MSTVSPLSETIHSLVAGRIKYFTNNTVGLETSTIVCSAGAREPEERHQTRRSSFRAVKPYEGDEEKMIKMDSSPVPAVVPAVAQPLVPDEERRTRRRGSQL